MRFDIIHELKGSHPIAWLAEIAEVQRSSYYKWVKTIDVREKKKEQDQGLMDQMLSIRLNHKEYGYPRMVVALKEEGFEVTIRRFTD
ncbi:hypothetical protein V7087_17465 [Neobacillus niacini]|uniref:hypothetical protein n=1 Tax=Neobacillus niacini TaxID=86668 RepID=UPI003000155F